MPTKAARKPARKPARKAGPGRKAFGRPGTAGKAEGDAAVRRWMAGVNPAHRPIVERLDALIGEIVPDVKRAIKWSTPMYGRAGQGWFASVASFKNYVSLNFFAGTRLEPPPPVGEGKGMRRVNLRDLSEFDEKQVRSWIQQAASMKGWGTV
jgi:hypothetical protein